MLKGTETEKNLLKAFAGESQARNKYTYFASIAKKEGYEQIANNEKEHAKIFFKYLEGGDVQIEVSYPAGVLKDTLTNLQEAANGEHKEWSAIYVNFAGIAKDGGFEEIAKSFEEIAKVERFH